MALTAAAAVSGFVVVLLCVPVIQGQNGWTVTYTPTSVCAVKGATVELSCTYTYPSRVGRRTTEVQTKMWFTKMQDNERLDLKKDSQYTNRVTYSDGKNSLSHKVTIRDLKESDTAEYKFRFITNQPGGHYTGDPGVTLSVTDPDLKVEYKSYYERKCTSRCHLPVHSSFVWYKNGREITTTSSSHYSTYSDSDRNKASYACALKGLKDFPSPPVCVYGDNCNRVTYTARSICASKGSSVDISCDFNSPETNVRSKLWFTTGPSPQQFSSPSGTSNQGGNSQSAARFQVAEPWAGHSTLRISDLRESDSAVYRFKFTAGSFEWGSSLHGTSLTVTALQVQVTRINSPEPYIHAELRCQSSCSPAGPVSYVWFKNREDISWEKKSSYVDWFNLEDEISCAFEGQEHFSSPSVYAPKRPSVLLNPSAEILENNSVNLTCSSDANPAAKYTWYKKTENTDFQPVSEEQQLLFPSVQSSDSGEYYCTAENQLGKRPSEHVHIDVQYAPKLPSVMVSPSAEIEEGMSVTLSCSSDANPEATKTWYKDNQILLQRPDSIVSFTSIKSEDSGMYHCESKNDYGRKNSAPVHIDVKYAPRFINVSASPSLEVMEGSSLSLTCSSDANPAANYTWFKKNEGLIFSGPVFTIKEVKPKHRGSYYCEAHNGISGNQSSLHVVAVHGSVKAAAAGSITVIILVVIFLCIFILIRKKRSPKEAKDPGERRADNGQLHMASVIYNPSAAAQRPSAEVEDDLCYSTVIFSKNQDDDPLYSNIVGVQRNRPREEKEDEEDVDYALVNVNSSCSSPELKGEDSADLYSTVMKKPR